MSAEAGPRHEVRKTVTVVFVDVTGSTSLGERLDPERVRRVMRSYFAAMREILERHGGTVEKFIGDAVMAVFGIPTVHEDDALRACRAAIDIRERLHHLNAELEREQGFTIEVRTGVNTGEVVAEEDASAEAMIVGDAVNVAARLEQEAGPGEILLGASTHRMVRDAVRAEPLEPITLKGKAEPVPAYRLLDLTPEAEPLPRRLVSPIVGRAGELAIMRQAFERATEEGALQLLTVLGSAGVGKSRLIAEFLAASEGEHQVLRGRCLPYGEGVTYLPLVAAIKAAAQITDEVAPEEAAEKLAALVEGDADGDLICGLVQQMLGLAPATAPQEELFWGARRLVEILASRLPVILVLDDIHWAEPTLLDLIEHLADWSRDAAILLICSARPELLDERPTWGGGKLNAASMLLEPLGAAASEELVDNLVGSEALPPASRTAITAAAEGNPLFVEEMLGVLVDDGVLRRVDGRWEARGDVTALHVPPTIHALLAARLDRLGRSEREVAQVASVVGRVFDRASVEAVVPEAARTAVRSTIMALVRKDLVRPDRAPSSGSEAFRFRHVLIRDAAYDGLPKEDRSRLHEAVADWLETTAGERKAEYLEIIGYHLEQAYGYRQELGVTGAADEQIAGRAADLLATAAQQAIARTDIPATISLLTRATSLLPPDDPRRIRLLPELANALGEVDDARATATIGEAVERAEAAGNELLRAHAVVLGHLSGLLDLEVAGEEMVNNNERESERGIKAFAAVQDQVGLSRAWRLRGSVESQRGRLAKCQAAIEKALEYARAAGDAREQADCIFQLSFTLTQGPTPVEEGIRRCTEVLAEYPGDRAVEGWMVHALAHLRARRGEFAEAAALAARCRQILQDTGQEASYALLSEVVADVHMLAGNVDGAIDVLTDAARTYERMGVGYPAIGALLARALCAAGRYDEAEPMATQGMTNSGPAFKALAKAQLAKVRAYAGDVEDAERLVTEAAAWFEPTDWLIQRGDILMDVAEIHRVSRRPDDARRATEQALETYRQKGDLVSARRADAQLREAPPG